MQELKLFEVGKIMDGGSTQPFGILAANENNEIQKYVVKCFKKKHITENFSTAKEILACEVAKSYDINVPEYAVIWLSISDLQEVYDVKRLQNLDSGFKFCSKFAETHALFSDNVTSAFLKDYDLENVFAFDVLIYNTDRGGFRKKSNVLIDDNELLLIDHELTLPFINDRAEIPNYHNYYRIYPYQTHIFYKYLQGRRDKTNMFEEFIENTRLLSTTKLLATFDEMDKYNISYGVREKFLNYFAWVKENTAFIHKRLKEMVQ